MPRIIDYSTVSEAMQKQGFKSLYFNSGAFGFPQDRVTQSFGWIGPADESIQPAAMPLTRQAPAPFAKSLAALAARAWHELLPGSIWIMPKSHWAYELEFGSREWMPGLLKEIGLDPNLLSQLNNAAAIEFNLSEKSAFVLFLEPLLEMLSGSDFIIIFSNRHTICTIHSHKQLWWTTADPQVAAGLERILPDIRTSFTR